jgi:hypothetical protein
MANGKLTWTPAGGVLQTYVLPVNFLFASKGALADKSDRSRAIDGTMRTYNFTLKQSYIIAFSNIPATMKDQLLAIKQAQVDVNFYADGANLTLTGQWVSGFNFAETSPGLWAGGIQLEEI